MTPKTSLDTSQMTVPIETKIFDGVSFAKEREDALRARLIALDRPTIHIRAILFQEDAGSRLYTGLKQEAAERVGITYTITQLSLLQPTEEILAAITAANRDTSITGIIIQKPQRRTWEQAVEEQLQTPPPLRFKGGRRPGAGIPFPIWWQTLVSEIDPRKDVDGLHPLTLAAIERGTWEAEQKVLPATAKAVLAILESSVFPQTKRQLVIAIIGKSDLLGRPLHAVLRHRGYATHLFGRKELEERIARGVALRDIDIVITATGQAGLITGAHLKPGAAVIDVGEPRPDVDRANVMGVAGFLTPVPGGVGPVTVISLLENGVGRK